MFKNDQFLPHQMTKNYSFFFSFSFLPTTCNDLFVYIFYFYLVSYYLIVVVPLGKDTTLPKDEPDSYFKRVKRSRRSDQSQHAPYIAAKFMANQLPDRFHVGEESSSNQFGYINKRLTKGSYYTIFSRAYVEKENKVSLMKCILLYSQLFHI